jgi:hypothetical protein
LGRRGPRYVPLYLQISPRLMIARRYLACTARATNGDPVQPDFLHLVVGKLQHSIVRPPFPPSESTDHAPRFSAGTLGPAVFGLSLRDSCLVILFFNLLASALPAYLCVSLLAATLSHALNGFIAEPHGGLNWDCVRCVCRGTVSGPYTVLLCAAFLLNDKQILRSDRTQYIQPRINDWLLHIECHSGRPNAFKRFWR